MRPEDIIKRIRSLKRGERVIYYNSNDPLRSPTVFRKAYHLYEQGHIVLTQKRMPDGSYNYIATGLLTDLDKQRMEMER